MAGKAASGAGVGGSALMEKLAKLAAKRMHSGTSGSGDGDTDGAARSKAELKAELAALEQRRAALLARLAEKS